MERKSQMEGEGSMYKRILRKRILKGLVVSLALFAVIPISNAAAKPVSLVAKDNQFTTRSSEISTGLGSTKTETFGVTGPERRAMIIRGEALNKKYNLGQYAFGVTGQERRAMILRGEGMNEKYGLGRFAVEPSNTGSDVPWSGAGIGIGIAALLIAGTAGALVVRSRQHGGLAH
jgi:hypothetical protein